MKKAGTLKELDVKPGDVLQWEGGEHFPCEVVEIDKSIVHMETPEGYLSYNLQYCCHPWVVISRASDKPKLWRDMNDAEKSALLLAHHEGKVIEVMDGNTWYRKTFPVFADGNAYRVRPEPEVEVIELYGNEDTSFYRGGPCFDTHCITFNIVDGEIDCSSVQMRKLSHST